MDVNADFTKRAMVHAAKLPWTPSPIAGVERRMLDRVGGEIARATSLVRYAPNSAFSPHVHTGGEEILVLEGVFQDEHGDFPTGRYFRNPPTTSHKPGSKQGCTILVKLWQFDLTDRTDVRVDTSRGTYLSAAGRPGVELMPLFKDSHESVRLERWAPGAAIDLDLPGGGEFFVLDGDFSERPDRFTKHSWLRLPVGTKLLASPGLAGCTLWVKTGHLLHVRFAPTNRSPRV